ncbi:MAG TPA: molecular chaperone DnaJ [Flavobacteriaceae bacterium]|nr:molecular chaperone DnaJ [Flavobacteriaceae bacterium]
MREDFYSILGIDKGASQSEIKRAYRKKALKYHPDKNPDDREAEAKFKQAAEAYEVLGNPEKKARYDQLGHDRYKSSQGFGGGGAHMDMDDIFSQFGDIFGGAFGGGFSGFGGFGGGGRGRPQRKGSNLRVRINLTLEEIAKGCEKKIKIKRKVQAKGTTYTTCSNCNGTGQVTRISNTILGRMQTASPCPECHGSGERLDNRPKGADAEGMISKQQTVTIQIPAGVVDGMQLKVTGKGNEAPGNGIPGDLLVAISEKKHEYLEREGDNLHYDLYISIPEAVLGGHKEIPTVEGDVRIKLEAGIQSGKTLRLRNKGIPSINGYGKGDLLVHVNVWTPQALDKQQRDFFEMMKDDENFAPNPEQSDKSFFEKVKDMFS